MIETVGVPLIGERGDLYGYGKIDQMGIASDLRGARRWGVVFAVAVFAFCPAAVFACVADLSCHLLSRKTARQGVRLARKAVRRPAFASHPCNRAPASWLGSCAIDARAERSFGGISCTVRIA